MRHLLALAVVLALAGACLAAEFKSDEAKKAQADYLAALDAAKTAYGQGLAKAKGTIDAKAAAATDTISKEAIQSESAAIIEELVRLRAADAAAFEPREWKSAETKKAAAAYAAELKAAQVKYGQDLTKARQTVLARKVAATDSAAKEALQAEIALIEEEQANLKDDGKGGKKAVKQRGWIDLLPLIDVKRDAVTGTWRRTADGISLADRKSGYLGIRLNVSGDFELEATFKKNSGEDVMLVFPVGGSEAMTCLGALNNAVSGIRFIDGKGVAENETKVRAGIIPGQIYTQAIRVSVEGDNASITVTLDGKPYTKWSGQWKSLSVRDMWPGKRNPKTIGLAMGNTEAFFVSARIRKILGEAKPRATSIQPQGGFSPVGEWQKEGSGTQFTFLADGRVQAPKAHESKYAEGTWASSEGRLTITFKDGEKMTFEIVNTETLKAAEWKLQRQAAGK